MISCQRKNKQSGIALIMALIMLLLVTMIGAATVKNSVYDTQIAGNSIYSSLAFQAAESAIVKSITQENIIEPATKRLETIQISSNYITDEEINGGAILKSKGTSMYDGIMEGPVINGVANSSEFKYQIIKFSAESSIQATSARDRHTEARAVQMPN